MGLRLFEEAELHATNTTEYNFYVIFKPNKYNLYIILLILIDFLIIFWYNGGER